MAKQQLAYERLKVAVVVWDLADVITASLITDNEEDTEKDFFAPFAL